LSKYHSKKATFNGITFDSKHEKDRYIELVLLEKAKAIQDLKIQQRFPLIAKSKYGREIYYRADFTYYENGELVVEDAKSSITRKNPVYRLKRRMMQERYNITIRET